MVDSQDPTALDRHFAELAIRLEGGACPELKLAALLVSRHQSAGNVCLPLEDIADQIFSEGLLGFDRAPKAITWARKLRQTAVVGAPGEFKPLILDDCNRLYLRRYWEYERSIAEAIKARLGAAPREIDSKLLEKGLNRLFGARNETDQQRVAAGRAVTQNFTVITGGPGTGKTRTVVAILALLIEQSERPLRFALAASSGKAAARLKESVLSSVEALHCSQAVKSRMPRDATTIHRLLGAIPDSPYFRHTVDHQLLVDAVIIDEASMVDLAMMAKLFAAIPVSARVILLGDKDQLASVESGFVLGDICNSPAAVTLADARSQLSFSFEDASPRVRSIQHSIVELQKNYRFRADSGIYQLVEAVNRGDAERSIAVLQDKAFGDLSWKMTPTARSIPGYLQHAAVRGYKDYLDKSDPAEALELFGDFRVLCAVRNGPFGTIELNHLIEEALFQAKLLHEREQWYGGRPVMVTRNDYNARLYNGDIGVTMQDSEVTSEKRVFFGSAESGFRRVLPSRLPVHETAFAMTVHKSQGSEFAKVLLILPEADSPLLTRELLYTGLTRARDRVEIWASERALRSAIQRKVTRSSGLRDALWQ